MQPTELNTQQQIYADFAKSFKIHPLTNDLVMNKNEMAIREALINIIFTEPGERPYSSLGVGINKLLFEPMGVDTTLMIEDRIKSNLINYEPRCNLISLRTLPLYDDNAYDITIVFSLINTPGRQFSVNFLLKRLR